MASTDALPIARKNTAFRVYIPIWDADGDLVTGAAGLDSEVSKDGGSFADCTNEATEIGTSGIYYLDLTATEMNADAVVVIVKTSTSGAKTTPIILYPAEDAELRANMVAVNGTSAPSLVSGRFDASVGAYQSGLTPLQPTVAGRTLDVSAGGEAGIDWANIGSPTTVVAFTGTTIAWSSAWDAEVQSECDDALEARGYTAARAAKIDNADVAVSTRLASASYSAPLDAAGTRTALGLATANLDTQLGAVPTAVWSAGTRVLTAGTNISLAKGTGVTGFNDLSAADIRTALGLASANLDVQLAALDALLDLILEDTRTTLPASIADLPTDADVLAQVEAALASTTRAELGAVPAANASIAAKLTYLAMALRNGTVQTGSSRTVRNASGTTIATQSVSDNGTSLTIGVAE